jgi:protein involved in polysaccharide export with SLBB domain
MSSNAVNQINQRGSGLLCGALALFACWYTACGSANSSMEGPPSTLSSIPAPLDNIGGQLQGADSAELEKLWKARLHDSAGSSSSGDFVLGHGDLMRISIPPIAQCTVRVSEDDTIALPLLGEISVAGMNEKDLRTALTTRMTKYRYHPQVEVFLQQAEDRQVAVLGAVKTPGRYMLTSRSDTLMTMVSRAGGVTEGAAARIFLIPAPASEARPNATVSTVQVASAANPKLEPSSTGSQAVEGLVASANAEAPQASQSDKFPGHPVERQYMIDTSEPESQQYMEVPARPGDVIVVPLAGEVTVQGWVERAGSFQVTSKMTVLNAIAAAGGAQFSSSATLLRQEPNGGKQAVALDLSKMKRGEQSDPPVEGGDVIVVERSALGALPYTASFIVQHVGLGFPVF